MNRSLSIRRHQTPALELLAEMQDAIEREETYFPLLSQMVDQMWEYACGIIPEHEEDFLFASLPVRFEAAGMSIIENFALYFASLKWDHVLWVPLNKLQEPFPEWALELSAQADLADAFDGYMDGLQRGNAEQVAEGLNGMLFAMDEEVNCALARFTENQHVAFKASLLDLWLVLPGEALVDETESASGYLLKLAEVDGYFTGYTLPAPVKDAFSPFPPRKGIIKVSRDR